MTELRKRMLEELQRRNYSINTIRPYLYAVEDFSRYFGKSPDKLRQEELRQYQLHLLNDRKLTVETIAGRISAIRFFFVKVLRRPYRSIDLVYPRRPERLPIILSEEEVSRLIESASNSYHRVILMMLYGTGLRREELSRLKLTDIDSQRMVIHVRQGKGNRDREVTLSPRFVGSPARLLEMAETQDLFVSQPSAQTERATDQCKNRVSRGPRSCAPRWN